jgi:hypothetical protein
MCFDEILYLFRITTYEALENKSFSSNDQETGRNIEISHLYFDCINQQVNIIIQCQIFQEFLMLKLKHLVMQQ